MEPFTLINLKDIEDQAPKHGLSPMIEARSGRVALGLERSGAAYYRYAPGYRTFGHRHSYQEEVYVVVGGGGRMKLGDEIVELQEWDFVRVSPGTPRAFEAGTDGLAIIAFGSPSDQNRDAEVLPNWWAD